LAAVLLTTAVVAGATAVLSAAPAVTAGAAFATPAVPSDWTVYHQNGPGTGVDPSGASFSGAGPAWTSPVLDGPLYGEPLEDNGLVIAATENDTVYALDVTTGAIVWQTHIADPVPSGDLPCGDIGPTVGITGTPVIDPSRSEVFVDADELTGGNNASHHLIGLDLSTGAIELDQVADPPGSLPLYQLQRPGLALDAGQVVMAYGGNAGDCGPYHGWVVAIPEGGGSMSTFEAAANPGDNAGAIWMGGAAPEVDGSGNIWVVTGNSAFGSSGDAYDNSDGVLELSSSLTLEQVFAPSTWYSDNAVDADLGSSAPALLSDGLALQAGKSQTAYVLSQSALGGVGGQLALKNPYCGTVVDGGTANVGDVVFDPCVNGLMATQVTGSPPTITPLWKTGTGAGAPPIVAGGLVWTINIHTGYLYGLDPSTGATVEFFSLGSEANHFPTASVADGYLLAPSATQVHAFAPGFANNPSGTVSLFKSSGVIGNLVDRVSGTMWNNNGDGSVTVYECASQVHTAGSCTSALATAKVSTNLANVGTFPQTNIKVTVGTMDADADTCGVSTSGPCYVVVVGNNGDSNFAQLHFAIPSAAMRKATMVVGNFLDGVVAAHFPIGDTVMAEECNAAVDPSNPGNNCDAATAITGHAGSTGAVVFSPSGIRIKVGSDYSDPSSGTCNPGTSCVVVVTDETNPLIHLKPMVALAKPTVTLSPATVPNALGYQFNVTAKNFPIGETVDAVECDTAYTVGNANDCDAATQISGIANAMGTVATTAWSPTIRLPVFTATTPTVYSDPNSGSCAIGDTVPSMHPCHVGTTDASNLVVEVSTPFGVT
jgi:hypothetical protein